MQDTCKIHRIRILITNPPKFDNKPHVSPPSSEYACIILCMLKLLPAWKVSRAARAEPINPSQPHVGRSQICVEASWLSPLLDDRIRAVVSRLLNKHGAERVPALEQHVHRQQIDEDFRSPSDLHRQPIDEDLREALQIFATLLKSGSEATGRLPE